MNDDNEKIAFLLQSGEIIAYPTEGVFGLGCDPLNESAVKKLLLLKQRPIEKGLIIIAANWQQLKSWIGEISVDRLHIIQQQSEQVITWLVPASEIAPYWIRGDHTTVAVRVTHHPVAREICLAFGRPIVSTSANISHHEPCRNYAETCEQFTDKVAYIIDAPTSGLNKPSEIRDAISGEIIRA